MGKLGLSAMEIGLRIGASAVEVNRLLKDQGFLDGEPNAWGLTEKGKEFGAHTPHDNGWGGAARRDWETTHFDPGIVEVLDSSPEKLAKVRAEIAAHRQSLKAARMAAQAEAEANFQQFQADKAAADVHYEIDPKTAGTIIASVLVVAGTAIGVYKGVRWYKTKKAEKAAQAQSDSGSATLRRPDGR